MKTTTTLPFTLTTEYPSNRPAWSSEADLDEEINEWNENQAIPFDQETIDRFEYLINQYVDYTTRTWENTTVPAKLDTIDADDFIQLLYDFDNSINNNIL